MAKHGDIKTDHWEQLSHRAYASLNRKEPVDTNHQLRADLARYGAAPRWVLDGLVMAYPHTGQNDERAKAWGTVAQDLVRKYDDVAAITDQILRCGVDETALHFSMRMPLWHERAASLVIEAACRVGVERWVSDEEGKSFRARRDQLKELEALNASVNARLLSLVGLAADIRKRADLARTVGAVVWKQDVDVYDVLTTLRNGFPAWGMLTRRELDRFVSVATVTSQDGPELVDLIEAIGSITPPAEVAIPTATAPYLSQKPTVTKKQKTELVEQSITRLGKAPFVLSFIEKLRTLTDQTGIPSSAKNGLWIDDSVIAEVMNLVCDYGEDGNGEILTASLVNDIRVREDRKANAAGLRFLAGEGKKRR